MVERESDWGGSIRRCAQRQSSGFAGRESAVQQSPGAWCRSVRHVLRRHVLHAQYHRSQRADGARERLEDIHISDPNSASTVVWTPPPGTNYSQQVWAPELHRINDKWFIYVTASNGNNATHRMYVLERDDPNPMGPYTFKGQLNTGANSLAIDGTVLQWEDQLYFIWSGWPGSTDGQQNLYIAQMSDPLTISSNRVVLSSPTLPWEQHGLPINEGPEILIHDDKLHIIYSASGYWTNEYALGRLTYDGVGSIMSASSWQKSPTPVFQQAGEVVGTGHASFTTSPDGTENWIVYHAHHDKNNWQDDRDVYIQPFEYNADGTPNFGSPIPADTPLSVPSGYVDPERPFVEGDFDASGNVDSADLAVWQAQYGVEYSRGFPPTQARTATSMAATFSFGNETLFRSTFPIQPSPIGDTKRALPEDSSSQAPTRCKILRATATA